MNSLLLFGIFSNIVATLKIILALIVVAFIVYLCVKIPQLVPVIGTLLAMTIFACGIFATIDCVTYFTAHNVTIGDVIKSTFNNKSEAEELEGETLAWDMKNLGFVYVGENTYKTTIEKPFNEAIDLENNDYVLYINDIECVINETGDEYVKSQFVYTFYDNSNNVILSDILYLNFGFYSKQTIIEIQTNGGETAVNLWKAFQVKNGFKFELKAQPKTEFAPNKCISTARTELLDNENEDLFTINIYVSTALDYKQNGHYASDAILIDVQKYMPTTYPYNPLVGTYLHSFYKSSQNGYNLYSANFESNNYKFFNFGDFDFSNFSDEQKEQFDGYYMLKGNSHSYLLEIRSLNTSFDIRDYYGINPMGKILNIYVDIVEI